MGTNSIRIPRRTAAAATLALALSPLLSAAPAHAAATRPSPPDAIASVTAPPVPASARADGGDAFGYWTPKRMREAIPADVLVPRAPAPFLSTAPSGRPGVASAPVGPLAHAAPATAGVAMPSTAGKLFFVEDGQPYVCSAATVNNAAKNLIETAGHCLSTGGRWHSNIIFAPDYYQGYGSAGAWNWSGGRTFQSWIDNNSDYYHDQAFITFAPKGGQSLVATVGANGFAYNQGQHEQNVRIWGWPAQAPYDGSRPYYCQGTTYSYGSSTDASMACGMNGGASGGPWLMNIINANVGYVFAVTSRRTLSGAAQLLATPNTADTYSLYSQMG